MLDLALKYNDKYEALSFREQVLLSVCVFVLIGIIWFLFVSEPIYLETKSTSSELETLDATISKLSVQRKTLRSRRDNDPHQELKKRIISVTGNINKANKLLADKFHGLIDPKEMARILESVLAQHSELRLLSVKSLPSEILIKKSDLSIEESNQPNSAEAVDEESKVQIYRHGFQITLEGNYLAVLKYLQTLEGLNWEFYWDGVSFEVTKYPTAQITLTIHTLSLSDSWIGV